MPHFSRSENHPHNTIAEITRAVCSARYSFVTGLRPTAQRGSTVNLLAVAADASDVVSNWTAQAGGGSFFWYVIFVIGF